MRIGKSTPQLLYNDSATEELSECYYFSADEWQKDESYLPTLKSLSI